MLGDAYHELMAFDKAALNYRTAMKALGCEEPTKPMALARGVLSNAVRQAMSRLLPSPGVARATEDAQRVAHMYERLSEEYFYSNSVLPLLHGTLTSLNLAERSGAVAETIAGYNALALALGMAEIVGLGAPLLAPSAPPGRRKRQLSRCRAGASGGRRPQLRTWRLGCSPAQRRSVVAALSSTRRPYSAGDRS